MFERPNPAYGLSQGGHGWAPSESSPSSAGGDFQLARPISLSLIDELLAFNHRHAFSDKPADVVSSTGRNAAAADVGSSGATEGAAAFDQHSEVALLRDNVYLEGCCMELVMSVLAPQELARCEAVCMEWRLIARQEHIRVASLCATWRVAGVNVGAAGQRAWTHLQAQRSLKGFVLKHLVQPHDTLSALAVHYGVPLMEIRRLNNIMSDSITCRMHLYVPALVHLEQLAGRLLCYEYDQMSKRGFAVVEQSCVPQAPPKPVKADPAKQAAKQKKLAALLASSLHIDDASAGYYLEAADGNIREAFAQAQRDAQWAAAEGRQGRSLRQ